MNLKCISTKPNKNYISHISFPDRLQISETKKNTFNYKTYEDTFFEEKEISVLINLESCETWTAQVLFRKILFQ